MEKDKEQRHQSAGEVRSELENIEKGIPTTEKVIPKRKPITSKEITVTFGLKKLFIPALAVIALVIAALIILQILPKEKAAPIPSEKPSIAVLPFQDLSSRKDQAYLCDGMTEELIAKLSKLKDWKVMNRNSVMQYKWTDKDIKEIGQELNVGTILLGTVRKEEDDIRVTAQLVNVEDRFQIWSDTYEKKLESVFAIQSDVAEKIANALQVELSPGEKEQLMEKPTENLLAYDYYLNGKALFYTYVKSNNDQAIVFFMKALDLDPSFSFAYSGLSKCYVQNINRSWDFDEKWLMLGEEAAKKAIELDNQSAEAYFALGFIHEQRNEYEEMEREMRNVLKLNPNHAHAHDSLGDVMHRWHGDLEEALQEYNKALALDPFLLPSYSGTHQIYVKQGKYGDAEQILFRMLEKQKNNSGPLRFLGRLYRFMGKYEPSVEMLKKALTINPRDVTYHVDLGLTYLLQNNIDGAQAEAKFMVETFDDTPIRNFSYHYLLGRILLEQGDFQSALQNFKQALQIKNSIDQSNLPITKGYPEDIFKAIAETYFRQGKFKEAIIELSRMDDSPAGSVQLENYMWALKHYKLGQIYEKMNNIEIAKKEYAKFLDLWKDADPGIPEVEDAKKRLAGLKDQ